MTFSSFSFGSVLIICASILFVACGQPSNDWKNDYVNRIDSLTNALKAERQEFEQLNKEKTKNSIEESKSRFAVVEQKNKYSRQHEFATFKEYRSIFRTIKDYDREYNKLQAAATQSTGQLEALASTIQNGLEEDKNGAKIDSLYIATNATREMMMATKSLRELENFNTRDSMVNARFEAHNEFVKQWVDSVAKLDNK